MNTLLLLLALVGQVSPQYIVTWDISYQVPAPNFQEPREDKYGRAAPMMTDLVYRFRVVTEPRHKFFASIDEVNEWLDGADTVSTTQLLPDGVSNIKIYKLKEIKRKAKP